jgi:hypothetical protein
MNAPVPHLSHLNLLFALLRRWMASWIGAKAPTRFVDALERTERELAAAIRATLTEDGVAFPALDDPTFLKWFAKQCRGSDQAAWPHRSAGGISVGRKNAIGVVNASPMDWRRFPAGKISAGRQPEVETSQHARAPP